MQIHGHCRHAHHQIQNPKEKIIRVMNIQLDIKGYETREQDQHHSGEDTKFNQDKNGRYNNWQFG